MYQVGTAHLGFKTHLNSAVTIVFLERMERGREVARQEGRTKQGSETEGRRGGRKKQRFPPLFFF